MLRDDIALVVSIVQDAVGKVVVDNDNMVQCAVAGLEAKLIKLIDDKLSAIEASLNKKTHMMADTAKPVAETAVAKPKRELRNDKPEGSEG